MTVAYRPDVNNHEQRGLAWPAGVLLATQLAHAAVPGPQEVAGSLGPIVGLVLLLWTVGALVGALRDARWARPLLRATGWAVAVGFLLYHALPLQSPLTFPYWGRSHVGPLQ